MAFLLLILLLPATAGAHAVLEASTPAPNGHLPVGASMIALAFSEAIDPRGTKLTLTAADGELLVAQAQRVPGQPQVVRFTFSPLEPGAYEGRWGALSVDGDVTQGMLRFMVGPGAAEAAGPVDAWEPVPGEPGQRAATGALRTLLVGSLVLLAGAAFFWGKIQRVQAVPDPPTWLLGGLALTAGLGAAGSLVDLAGRLDVGLVPTLATIPGRLLAVTFVLCLVPMVLAALMVAQSPRHRPRRLGLLSAAALAPLFGHALVGHAVAGGELDTAFGDVVMVATVLHLAAVSLWTGGVLALTLSALAARGPGTAELILRFSPWAVGSVLVLAGSGLVMAAGNLGAPQDLWTTGYGQLLAAKGLGLLGLVALGAWHRYRTAPRAIVGPTTARAGRGTLGAEVACMVGVLALASLLAVSPLPSPPVDLDEGPAVGQPRAVSFGDYQGTLLLPDPLDAGGDQALWLELTSRTFQDLDPPRLHVARIEAGRSTGAATELRLQAVEEGRWRVQGPVFPEAGTWLVTLEAPGPAGLAQNALLVDVASPTAPSNGAGPSSGVEAGDRLTRWTGRS